MESSVIPEINTKTVDVTVSTVDSSIIPEDSYLRRGSFSEIQSVYSGNSFTLKRIDELQMEILNLKEELKTLTIKKKFCCFK